ncbi:DNA-directed RNA polymerase subunit beta [Bryobacter aggregatus]|uniref:DNA-directed RNA polymerase subunit beta n=1 Tax=Bryobacter aggregatus TaxID=360054 RepID=UPI0004E25BA2|nr:DNA-directed RNA polymerase subunit beta [Bryobacter aggregatus]
MQQSSSTPAYRPNQPITRVDFSRIKSSIPIPNLIEVQKLSYERFLQMDLLPDERDEIGLQSVFKSVFPITDFRGLSQLDFVDYAIGNWECKCSALKGLNHLRSVCRQCGSTIKTDPFHAGDVLCHHCGTFNKNIVTFCNRCGDPVGLQLKYDIPECEERGMTFSAPLKVTIRLTVYDKDPDNPDPKAKTVRDIKEQEVFFGEIPLMTPNGTFVINGTERVIVSQLHRSPGVFFERVPAAGYHLGKIIPYRGSWVEFEYDNKNYLFVRIDRKRKFYGTVFLRALGFKSDEQIIKAFYTDTLSRISLKKGKLMLGVADSLRNQKLSFPILNKAGETIVTQGKKITSSVFKLIKENKVTEVEVAPNDLEGAHFAADVIDMETGEILAEANHKLTETHFSKFLDASIESIEIFFPERDEVGVVISETIRKDEKKSQAESLLEIYRKLRPGDPPTLDTATQLFQGMFFDPRKYDFSRVGRMKFNIKIHDDEKFVPEGWVEKQEELKKDGKQSFTNPLDRRTLDHGDFISTIKYLLKLRRSIGAVDDIDHLGNRRVRAVGELLENQFRIGLVRMERAIKEKMSVYQEMSTAMPHDLVNAKPVMAAIREFFGSSQLSQFMDQTNPLSEITHKRRLSALGPGGLSRERAGFEVRDVHPTHYGRICPIETPEGPNIGLISSLSCFARINDYGFIESPYRRVEDGHVVDEVKILNPGDTSYKVNDIIKRHELEKANKALGKDKQLAEFESYSDYLSAWEEDKYIIAQANIPLDEKGKITAELVNARQAGNFVLKTVNEVQYMDVSPKQLVSVAASLIPFLENDDANRALMGSNMQRQAVPLLRADSPVVGTGMEKVTARDSGAVVICKRAGIVDSVDSERIIVRVDGGGVAEGQMSREVGADIYPLTKFKRSNQNTCINQKPIAYIGQRVRKGDVLADGPCTDAGELALGRNVLVAFMPWRGYNFEDAIVISEKMVKEDYYTSIHIEEFEIEARDTKLGPEEITRDIPNISESFLRNLDESGIIRIGATVKPGDILVGKVTPKGETQLTPEEKLLRAIFGEKAGDVKDASLYCPPGIEGVVVDAKVFSRKGADLDERSKLIQEEEVQRLDRNLADEKRILNDERSKRLENMLGGRILQADLHDEKTNKKLLSKGQEITRDLLEKMRSRDLKRMRLDKKDPLLNEKLDEIEDMTSRQIAVLEKITEEKKAKLKKGDELPPGVIKLVKCYIAMKRKLSVGDKMAGRHGNKGVIARIVPEEDMPYLPDGTPVEIVLNPLGVPSRMNVGQILETHLGWAARALGVKFATPVFDGATEKDIKEQLSKAGLPSSGKIKLVDGMTGMVFEQPVTVGYIYMLKLSHLVDDKIHARSIGPYSLITQQPLGGKAQFGGQRFGEMEVWALEAYGAAYILQELLTAKSDDVYGRAKIYEAIVKGEAAAEPGVPESFNVLIRELQSLCLDVELMKMKKLTEDEDAPVDTALAAD